jgi:hypothetical protein
MSRIGRDCAVATLAGLLCLGFCAAKPQEIGQKAPRVETPKPATRPGPQNQTPRLIGMDLLIAELAPRKGEGAKSQSPEKQLDARDLSGPMDEVLSKVDALKKTGQISYFRRIQLSSSEGLQATVSIGEIRPTVSGVTMTGTGHSSKNITYRPTGTNVKVTARVAPDGHVLMDLNVEDTRGQVPDEAIVIGTEEKGQPVRAEEWITAKLTTQLSVVSGRAKAAEVVTTSSKSGQAQTLVIAGARIVEP